jgi:hypothetical protein
MLVHISVKCPYRITSDGGEKNEFHIFSQSHYSRSMAYKRNPRMIYKIFTFLLFYFIFFLHFASFVPTLQLSANEIDAKERERDRERESERKKE